MVDKPCKMISKINDPLAVCECINEEACFYVSEQYEEDDKVQEKDAPKTVYLVWYGVPNGTPLKVIPFSSIYQVQAFYKQFEDACYLTGTKPSEQCRYYIQAFGDYKSEPEPIYPFPAPKKESKKKVGKGKKKQWSDSESSD